MRAARALKRLLTMDPEEIRFRTSTAVRREADRLASFARRPVWRRRSLRAALDRKDPLVCSAIKALKNRDWIGAHEVLMQHFATRDARFVLDPRVRRARKIAIRRVFPDAAADAARRAESILTGHFDLLGYRDLVFSDAPPVCGAYSIDWHFDPVHQRRAPNVFWSRVPYLHPSCGDHKIIWELNRHQSWLQLGRAYWLSGDRRYRVAFVDHLERWMAANPPLVGINWASMLELGMRAISWVWALHFFAAASDEVRLKPDTTSVGSVRLQPDGHQDRDAYPWTVDLLLGLHRQMSLAERNLSRYFSPNTHLLGEALGLYVVGRALPELRRAAKWEQLGRRVLVDEIRRQIAADGGHRELSTHYHRYTLDFYLLALAIAQATGDSCAGVFADAAARLARFARTMADDSGRLPCLGDEDGGSLLPICGRDPADVSDSLQLAASLLGDPSLAIGPPAEEVVWMTGEVPAAVDERERWRSAPLRETGYFVSRTSRGDHLVVDAGPHGFLNGGHAHADALSLTLTVRGRPLLIDPGTGCYTIDVSVRDRLRSTPCHNTLTLNGQSQSTPDGPFHWRTAASGMALDWQSGEGVDYFEGSHDGYAPLVHHRSILARPGCWFIVDRVVGAGSVRADAHWHFQPGWTVERTSPECARARHADGSAVWFASPDADLDILRGTKDDSGLGWCAPVYGPLVETSTLRATHTAGAPFGLVTVIVESPQAPHVERLPVTAFGEQASEAVAFRITTADWTETVIFTRRADSPRNGGVDRTIWSAGGVETAARVLCCREIPGREPFTVVAIDGGVARQLSPRVAAQPAAASA